MERQGAAATGMERKSLQLQAAGGGRPRLLLAEDCDPVRIVTSAMLKAMGCDVEAVVHGEQAVKCARESRFDVIVLDIEMPVMDGITAARSIRRLGGVAGTTPLMALSAFLADSVRNGHWRETFDIALPKPANRNELHGAVKAALLCQPLEARNPPPDPLPLLDVAAHAAFRTGITAGIWDELAGIACRDIEVCIDQLGYIHGGSQDGAVLTYATKLESLGRTFAAPRLESAARQVQLAVSQGSLAQALELLLAGGRDTVAALRG